MNRKKERVKPRLIFLSFLKNLQLTSKNAGPTLLAALFFIHRKVKAINESLASIFIGAINETIDPDQEWFRLSPLGEHENEVRRQGLFSRNRPRLQLRPWQARSPLARPSHLRRTSLQSREESKEYRNLRQVSTPCRVHHRYGATRRLGVV